MQDAVEDEALSVSDIRININWNPNHFGSVSGCVIALENGIWAHGWKALATQKGIHVDVPISGIHARGGSRSTLSCVS